MKLVSAYIKPFKLDDVREALTKTGVKGLSITEIKGFGRQKGQTEIYRGEEYTVSFLPKIKIETLVEDKVVKKVVEAILTSAKTDRIGDGKVFVTKVEDAIRIRTRESGSKAL
ncbi:MAG: P-II family nitrogen regulator [Pseudomonadota bacterium]|nr:P-II family nitrogen regulator [Pseudomonadota bacterium]MEC8875859.1 P-II family nitrogen regulator [Pseudomonadota bacterium]MED5339033.1 P-II family nitrogen regulator [Pseudomonadota bacterium]MEE3206937.1 P-II family nitrogen regulator [Pseudomonadota bacterium]MEE3260215.1 P-II family nitrogen regulator [Pseudomonadota bacterium]|tara:strand:- start:114 stop:452 length:339 start_codon:yes stop_codon:yes gene_type:complete